MDNNFEQVANKIIPLSKMKMILTEWHESSNFYFPFFSNIINWWWPCPELWRLQGKYCLVISAWLLTFFVLNLKSATTLHFKVILLVIWLK